MKACIIGAGPAGLYTAKYLQGKGISSTIYEKSSDILGNYKYTRIQNNPFESILDNKDIKIELNKDHTCVKDSNCDFYVLATGGIPKIVDIKNNNLLIKAIDLIKQHYNGGIKNVGNKIAIIGMGNVAFDLLEYLYPKCRDITLFSKGNLENASFDNHVAREVLSPHKYNLTVNSDLKTDSKERKIANRIKIIKDGIKSNDQTKPNLKMIFNSSIKNISKEDSKIKLNYKCGNEIFSDVYDTVISSIGFIPNKVMLNTKKPVFSVGWCNNAYGNINDARESAEKCVEEIDIFFKK